MRTQPRLPEAGKVDPINSPRVPRPTAVCTAPRLPEAGKDDPINSPRVPRPTAVCTASRLKVDPINSPRVPRPTAVCTAPRLKVDPINSPRVPRPTAVCTAPRVAACSGSVAPPAARASSALTSTAAGRGGRRGTGHVWPGTAPPPCRAKRGGGGGGGASVIHGPTLNATPLIVEPLCHNSSV